MFVFEFILLILSSITGIYASTFVFRSIGKSPLQETKILALGILVFGITFLFYTPITLLSGSSPAPIGILSYKIGSILATVGLYLVFLALYLPTFQLKYKNIMFLLLVNFVYMTSMVVNFEIDILVTGGRILIVYPPITATFISLSQFMFAALIITRVRQVSKITGSSPFESNFSLFTVALLAIASTVSIAIPVVFPDSLFPTFTNALFVSFLFLFFSMAFSQDEAFFFITSAHLDAILIADSQSGLSIFSKNFNTELPTEHLLTSVFTALNLSIVNLVKSESDVDEIVFGDKVILIERRGSISVFMITTIVNFLSKQIIGYIAENFYKSYGDKLTPYLLASGKIHATLNFDQEVKYVKRYMPH